jgi:hypothetical protein
MVTSPVKRQNPDLEAGHCSVERGGLDAIAGTETCSDKTGVADNSVATRGHCSPCDRLRRNWTRRLRPRSRGETKVCHVEKR